MGSSHDSIILIKYYRPTTHLKRVDDHLRYDTVPHGAANIAHPHNARQVVDVKALRGDEILRLAHIGGTEKPTQRRRFGCSAVGGPGHEMVVFHVQLDLCRPDNIRVKIRTILKTKGVRVWYIPPIYTHHIDYTVHVQTHSMHYHMYGR